jgi:hypothetical protein
MGRAFSTMENVAITASGADYRWVHPIWGRLLRIDTINGDFAATADKPQRDQAGFAAKQAPLWDELYAYVGDYRRWLRFKLTRKFWQWKVPAIDDGPDVGGPPR